MSDESAPEFDINKSLTMQFGTPFVSYLWPDSEKMNEGLAKLILAEEEADDEGRGIRSNAGGWQSRGNLMTRSEPEIVALKARMETMVFDLLALSFARTGRSGNSRSCSIRGRTCAGMATTTSYTRIRTPCGPSSIM